MAPHMSKTAAAAAVVAGTAFVSLPSQRSAPTSRAPALRGNAPAHANATGMMSTVGRERSCVYQTQPYYHGWTYETFWTNPEFPNVDS